LFIDVALVPGEALRWRKTVCIVVDVLRASSSIVTLFDRGCRTVVPAGSVAEARWLARAHGYVLAGERDGLMPPGFDFGNSPAELARAELEGRITVLATSNGTVVLRRLADAPAVLIGCLLNATACCRQALALAQRYDASLGIVCAGRDGSFVLDDGVCVGFLVETVIDLLRSRGDECILGDAARAAWQLWHSYPNFDTAFRESASGRRVVQIGQEEDIAFCARPDVSRIVPILVQATPPHIERLI
jgi:2-phosphosulfolactate phosphatase